MADKKKHFNDEDEDLLVAGPIDSDLAEEEEEDEMTDIEEEAL